jgi:hypothetical protein
MRGGSPKNQNQSKLVSNLELKLLFSFYLETIVLFAFSRSTANPARDRDYTIKIS